MKILNAGNPKPPWWVGKRIRCESCKFEAELERADRNRANYCWADNPQRAGMLCPNCNTPVLVEREEP